MKFLLAISLSFCLFLELFAAQYLYISRGTDIEQYSLNESTGELNHVESYPTEGAISHLALSADQNHLVANISDKRQKPPQSSIATFKIGSKGKLTSIANVKTSYAGQGFLSRHGQHFLQYNYGKNDIYLQAMKDHVATGKMLSSVTTTKNPHDIAFSRDEKLIFVPHNWENLMYQFSFDPQVGKFVAFDPPYIKGPDLETKGYANFRSMDLHPKLNVLYCTYEKGGGIASLKYDNQKGIRVWQEFSSTHEGQTMSASKVSLSPNLDYLFMVNRFPKKSTTKGKSSIASFKLDPETGKILHRVGIYETTVEAPREIKTDKTGQYVFASTAKANSLSVHRIQKDGSLKQLKAYPFSSSSMVCLKLVD